MYSIKIGTIAPIIMSQNKKSMKYTLVILIHAGILYCSHFSIRGYVTSVMHPARNAIRIILLSIYAT
jgi:hypothetical protein